MSEDIIVLGGLATVVCYLAADLLPWLRSWPNLQACFETSRPKPNFRLSNR
jgi:hypothetical protein